MLHAGCPPKPVGTACDELSRVVADPTMTQVRSFIPSSIFVNRFFRVSLWDNKE